MHVISTSMPGTVPRTVTATISLSDPKLQDLVQDMNKLFQERVVGAKDTIPDANVVETFATAIDDIINGRKPKPRPRTRKRSDRTPKRSDRTPKRSDRAPKRPDRSLKRSDRTCVFCERCGATFTSVGNLNRHRRVSHQGLRVFCDFKDCKQVCCNTAKKMSVQ